MDLIYHSVVAENIHTPTEGYWKFQQRGREGGREGGGREGGGQRLQFPWLGETQV